MVFAGFGDVLEMFLVVFGVGEAVWWFLLVSLVGFEVGEKKLSTQLSSPPQDPSPSARRSSLRPSGVVKALMLKRPPFQVCLLDVSTRLFCGT